MYPLLLQRDGDKPIRVFCGFGLNAVDQNAPEYNGPYGGWSGILTGPAPDATSMVSSLQGLGYGGECWYSGWNIGGTVVPWVMSSQTTIQEWKDAHAKCQAVARPGDRFFFLFSGHGGQYETLTSMTGGTYICFYDGTWKDHEQHQLDKGWPEGVIVDYWLDSCHSAGMKNREFMDRKPKSAPYLVQSNILRQEFVEIDESAIKASIFRWCACLANETAADGAHNGAFTSCGLEVIRQAGLAGHQLTRQELLDGISALAASAFPDQHPGLNVLGGARALMDDPI